MCYCLGRGHSRPFFYGGLLCLVSVARCLSVVLRSRFRVVLVAFILLIIRLSLCAAVIVCSYIMPCFHPLKGYRSNRPNSNGKFPIVFTYQAGFVDQPVTLPCGQCVGCRLKRSGEWMLRCLHESKRYENNCFLTLTYDDDFLPEHNSLVVSHHQDFMKRLKSRVRRKLGVDGIKFYMCGEYGEKFGRPHYHYCVFNFDFADKRYKRVNPLGDRIFTSSLLEELWPVGQSEIGSVTARSAGYVARYIMKKITGDDSVAYYGDRIPEFNAMSNGIGRGYMDRYGADVFRRDYIIHDGVKHRPPRFYDGIFENGFVGPMKPLSLSPMKKVKSARRKAASKHKEDCTPERLQVREKVQLARIERLKRELK